MNRATRQLLRLLKSNPVYANYLNKSNRRRYGPSAPRFAETIWVTPSGDRRSLSEDTIAASFGQLRLFGSAEVIEHDWPSDQTTPLSSRRIQCCIRHWADGVPWEATGVYEIMKSELRKLGFKDGCRNDDDIVLRYKNLDAIFEQAKQEGRLRSREEIDPRHAWDKPGLVVHLGPYGLPFWSDHGYHRFAIASVLNLPLPVQIGLVHVTAIPHLHIYRRADDRPVVT
jgi:hypothetical protein